MHYVVMLKVEQTKGCDNLCSSFLPKESSIVFPSAENVWGCNKEIL